MNITYITNYSNASLTCDAIDNVTTICQGTIAVIPYNQDVVVALQVIQTGMLILIFMLILLTLFVRR